MAKKGTPKNTKNKAKHSKLMDRKKNKARKEKDARAARLKEIIKSANAKKEETDEN
ncbi:hypothetical protein ACH3O9_05765 [Leeuwenhoekiella sp. A16]|uniref:hypothetical protein n=1 Tax=unclassified Leeuwenhoekiella TaxID=2615029 RepID=UPI003A7FF93F|tara:strand:- start:55 stop:222 length:168 start_codon:yes stop_codon:yes gene_type:complete